MSTSWDSNRARQSALRALVLDADQQPDGSWPQPATQATEQVLGGRAAVLLGLHARWQVTLLARADDVLDLPDDERHRALDRVVQRLAADQPGLSALLRGHEQHPALATARATLARHLALACSCGTPHTPYGPATAQTSRVDAPAATTATGTSRFDRWLPRCRARAERPLVGTRP